MKPVALLVLPLALAGCAKQADTPPPDGSGNLSTAVENRQVAPAAQPEESGDRPSAPAPSHGEDREPAAPDRTGPPAAAQDYRAIGTEPFWAVTVRGSTATLDRPDKPATRYAIVREADGRSIRYLGPAFAMTVTEGPCSDGMSDAIWSDRVSLAFGEGTLKGCGGERTDPADEEF